MPRQSTALNLEIIDYLIDTVHLRGELLRTGLLPGRLDDSIERNVPLFVSTSTRVRLEALSAANLVLTAVVTLASSTLRPALFPGID